jgi:hypothetical protein
MFELQPEEIGDSHPLVRASINAEDALLATAGTGNKTHAANVGYLLADNTPAFLVFSKTRRAQTLCYLRNLCTCNDAQETTAAVPQETLEDWQGMEHFDLPVLPITVPIEQTARAASQNQVMSHARTIAGQPPDSNTKPSKKLVEYQRLRKRTHNKPVPTKKRKADRPISVPQPPPTSVDRWTFDGTQDQAGDPADFQWPSSTRNSFGSLVQAATSAVNGIQYLYGSTDKDTRTIIDKYPNEHERSTCNLSDTSDTMHPTFMFGSLSSAEYSQDPTTWPVSFIEVPLNATLSPPTPSGKWRPKPNTVVATRWGSVWCIGIVKCAVLHHVINVTYADGRIQSHDVCDAINPARIGLSVHANTSSLLGTLSTSCNLIEDDVKRADVLLALQVRLVVDHAVSYVSTTDKSDTFAELSPNMLQKAIEGRDGVFCDLGCGTGLQLFVAAVIGNFSFCYGIERNVDLIVAWKGWSQALLRTCVTKWGPIIAKISVVAEDICDISTGTKLQVQECSVLLCWNARFTDPVNKALFELANVYMTQPKATLICFTEMRHNLTTTLVSKSLPSGMQYSSLDYWTMNFTIGSCAGDWFHLFENHRNVHETARVQGQDINASTPAKASRGTPKKKGAA